MIIEDGSGHPREVRWTARRKARAVQQLLSGTQIEVVAVETGATATQLSAWRETFIEAGTAGLKGGGPAMGTR